MSATPQNSDALVNEKDLYLAFRLMKAKDFDGARERIQVGLDNAKHEKNPQSEGLFLSALGVLHKLKNEFRESYKYYQQAEKLLPDDESLKVITATLLIHEFHQYDLAIRKLKKVLDKKPKDAAVTHHCQALLGVAYLGAGKKPQAKTVLSDMIAGDFASLGSAGLINYKLPEVFIEKNFEVALCESYLLKALSVAEKKRETVYKQVISVLLSQLSLLKK
jgi:tetratricopeptide (TPR) repeat protein